jgi:hypothetical protein
MSLRASAVRRPQRARHEACPRKLSLALVEPMGFEPTTSTVQTSRSSQLSYGPAATGVRLAGGGAEGSRTPDL